MYYLNTINVYIEVSVVGLNSKSSVWTHHIDKPLK